MGIKKPVIVFGTGRSGTSIFHRMLSTHPEVAWLSELCEKHPKKPGMNRILMKALEYPIINKILAKKMPPFECYAFWEYYCTGFSMPCRDLLSTDLTERSKKRIQTVMPKILTKNKNRLLVKVTGWPRLGFLSEIFEDAKFIHVKRDGRAVANSIVSVDFWWGWRGPENWRWGPLSAEYEAEWEKYNQSFIVLAAIQWKILMDAIEKAKKYVNKSNLLEIKYEDLCENPIAVMKDVAKFSELEWNADFETQLSTYNLRNTNTKWQQELKENQQQELNEVLQDALKKYDYL
ncbi:sulfotransferase [Candidatus Pacearchaeota archaeon]|nr:sulfotransferase [Candidatus Pacearchaeota archaeon]